MVINNEILNKGKEVLIKEAKAILQCENQIDENLIPILDIIFNCKGHILVTGAGTSRTIAQRFAHLLSCCGTPAIYLNASDALNGGAGTITENDVLYMISKGGSSDEINKLAVIAKKRKATLIAQTENPNSELGVICDAVYNIKSPEGIDPYGMIATGSSLVNAVATDVLSVLLLEVRNYSKEQFGLTHPEGAVGIKLQENS